MDLSANAKSFVQALMTVDPGARLSSDQALQHPWLVQKEQRVVTIDPELAGILCSYLQASDFWRACTYLMAWSLSNEERSAVRDTFLEIDINHTGKITLAGLRQVLQAQNWATLETFDLNVDPILMSEEIHYSDFLAAVVSARSARQTQLLQATFRRFDIDGSGRISKAKVQTVLGDSVDVSELDCELSLDGFVEYVQYLKGQKRQISEPLEAEKEEDKPKKQNGKKVRKRMRSSIIMQNRKRSSMSQKLASLCCSLCGP